MIIAIEGASAAGKTTWCRSHFPHQHVPETPNNIAAPDLFSDPPAVAAFWVNHAIQNWRRALEIEQQHGLAICDGDPFHLYFSWALWKSGTLGRELFDVETRLYRAAFKNGEIGLVDHVFWIEVSADDLRRRASADTARKRKRHELYLALLPWMKTWFEERERTLPGTVHDLEGNFDPNSLPPVPNASRYNLQLFDNLLQSLSGE